ncbi:MAG: hypothetical protein EA352_10000 [Gemmatimonadales bacterium]|nr:MAG: hypothetical protein EA352_10000 [Gemmatimonadales bacterium]
MSDRPASGRGTPSALLGDTVALGARRLADSGSNVLVVLGPRARAWGVVTCRDLVVHCLARGRDPDGMTLSQVLMAGSDDPVFLPQEVLPEARDSSLVDSPGGAARLEPALGILRQELERLGGNGAGR